jgi:hypothetical protein
LKIEIIKSLRCSKIWTANIDVIGMFKVTEQLFI